MLVLVSDGQIVQEVSENAAVFYEGTYISNAFAGFDLNGLSLHEVHIPEEGKSKEVILTGIHYVNGRYEYTVEEVEPAPVDGKVFMPPLSMVEFRKKLREVETEECPEGIYEEDILAKIDTILDRKIAAEAKDYFMLAQYVERTNPWVDILGAMFELSPERIDEEWLK